MSELRAPFPWFGGKRLVAEHVWQRFGDVGNFVEPFFGSGAVLLGRPHPARIETVNDKDCYIANFWRAVQADPRGVAEWSNWPVNEADLHARHLWLVRQKQFIERMKTDPQYFDVKVAGWWVWGICCWIGSGWCVRPEWSGRINASRAERGVHATALGDATWRKRPQIKDDIGVHRKSPALKRNNGSGVHRTLETDGDIIDQYLNHVRARDLEEPDGRRPSLGNAGNGVHKKRPALHEGRGVNKRSKSQLPDISGSRGAGGRGVHGSGKRGDAVLEWMFQLQHRLRNVRVCCGDWHRVVGRSPTECIGVTAMFLDPPYGERADRRKGIYHNDSLQVADEVAQWCRDNGDNPKLRIALCGYEGEHQMPADWTVLKWKANGGHGNSSKKGKGRDNAERERIWFSPHCLEPQRELFAANG